MRKIIGIIVCLWVAARLFAVDYQPFAYSTPATEFRSTSAYMASAGTFQSTADRMGTTSSFTAISASNFQALNSEDGASSPSAASGPRRVGRPGSGSGGIGVIEDASPVGETPFILFALLAALYIGFTLRRKAKVKE